MKTQNPEPRLQAESKGKDHDFTLPSHIDDQEGFHRAVP